jgi:threonyl-tRNA synthetase
MKILLIHSDGLEVYKKKPATSNPQEFEKDKLEFAGLILVAFVSVEDQDTYDTDIIATQGADVIEDAIYQIEEFPEKISQQNEEIREINLKIEKGEKKGKLRKQKELILDNSKYKVDKVVVYPWAHLSKFLSNDKEAMDVCPKIAEILKDRGIEAAFSPFGWYKAFKINCLGHELAEMYRDINLYIQPEEHIANAVYKIITPEKEELDLQFDSNQNYIFPEQLKKAENKDLKVFLDYQLRKTKQDLGEEPAHIKLMQRFELTDFDKYTDRGNFRWYPKGVILKELIREYVRDKLIDCGVILVDTPIMYTVKNKKLTAQTARFPARTYWVTSGDDRYSLRFASDFLQFQMVSEMLLKPDYLPLRLYEYAQYAFRREQEGELSGLRRLRGFIMPDWHTFCKDLKSAIAEFRFQYDIVKEISDAFGLPSFITFRVTQEFYEKNKGWILELVEQEGIPALLELWEERYYYFILKFERDVLSATGKSATLGTIQIDVESSLDYIMQGEKKREKYNIKFKDANGEIKHPIILHNSPSGAIERVVWALLETAIRYQDELVPGLKAWLSPVQVRIIPISERELDYAEKLMVELNRLGYRADLDDRNEKLGKKIRSSEVDWIPYVVIVGAKEKKNKTISIRKRRINEPYGEKKSTSINFYDQKFEKLLEMLKKDTDGFPKHKLPIPFRNFSTKINFR